jgi:hypothetical protein
MFSVFEQRTYDVYGVPLRTGSLYPGSENDALAYREAGLLEWLPTAGIHAADCGDVPIPSLLPHHSIPPVRNWPGLRIAAGKAQSFQWIMLPALRTMRTQKSPASSQGFFTPYYLLPVLRGVLQILIGINTYRDLYSASGSSGRTWPADCESLNSSRTSPSLPSDFKKSMI